MTIRFENVAPLSIEEDEAEDEKPRIIRRKRFELKPMSAEEAILQMDLLGHNFFIYQDAESDEIAIVYKRKDGNYGLIEPFI